MTRWLIGSSLRLAPVLAAVAAVVLSLGIAQTRHAAVDSLPEFGPPRVQVQTDAPGLSAVEVEQFITVPLEDELNGVAWVDQIHSRSIEGLSTIDLTFQRGTDVLRARQLVTERLAQGPGVANIGTPPVMVQPVSAQGRVMMISLGSTKLSLVDLSTLARWKIRPRLMGVPGVANVDIWGQRDQQLQVLVDPVRLHRNNVTLNQVIDTTGNALWSSPLTFVEASAPGTDGFVDTPNQRLPIQHVLPITSAEQLAQVTLSDTGDRTVRLGEVADVVKDHQVMIGDAVLDDGPGIMLVVEKLPGADTLEVSRAVQAAMDSLRPGLAGVTVDTTVFRPASFLRTALHNIGLAAAIGLLLMILLFGAVLRSFRAALVATAAVVLSLVAAAYVLYLRGATFTGMTLVGLVVALGVVVDDAVGGVVALRRERGAPRWAPGDLVEAYARTRAPLGYATVVLVLAALPVLLLTGVSGDFGRPLVTAYLLAVAVSLAVALTVTPALATLLPVSRARPTRLGGWLRRGVNRSIAGFARRPVWGYLGLALLALATLALVPQLRAHPVLPELQDRDLVIAWQADAGTSLQAMDRVTASMRQQLRAIPGVRTVSGEVGRALTSDRIVDVNSGELWVNVRASAGYGSTVAAIRRAVDGYPGIRYQLFTYANQQLREVDAGRGSALTVRLYGQDYTELANQARRVASLMSGVHGVRGATVQSPGLQPTIEIQVDLSAAQRYGLKPGDVRRAAATLISGLAVGSLYQDQQIFDVVVWGVPAVRDSLASVRNLLLDTPAGGQVRLRDVAAVKVAADPMAIDHDATSRYVDVTADVRGADLGTVLAAVRGRVAATQFPLAYRADVFSDLTGPRDANHRLLYGALAALAALVLLLHAALRGWRAAALVTLTLWLSGTGAVLAALLVGTVKSLGALAGLLLVFGVAARAAIAMVRRYQQLAGERPDAVVAGTQERAPQVLLAILAVVLALTPFIALRGVPGGELLRPLAVTVLGGLASTALVTLYVLPSLYLSFYRQRSPDWGPRPPASRVPVDADGATVPLVPVDGPTTRLPGPINPPPVWVEPPADSPTVRLRSPDTTDPA
jgi:Cu/Ag efflux pump CusA